jgi:hypothetical protein
LKHIVGIYIRMDVKEIARLCEHPDVLPKYDPRVALGDGRGLDLGRAWEELGVFLDGGVQLPDIGPTVGEIPMASSDGRAAWSYVTPERVVSMAAALRQMRRDQFRVEYQTDNEDTQELPGARTGSWGDRGQYMYGKLRALAAHYAKAAESGEAMLVRIGERM